MSNIELAKEHFSMPISFLEDKNLSVVSNQMANDLELCDIETGKHIQKSLYNKVFKPTTKMSPKALASDRYLICPTCKTSKQPFVKQIRFLFLCQFSRSWASPDLEVIFFSKLGLLIVFGIKFSRH